jgi:hypothetical protein
VQKKTRNLHYSLQYYMRKFKKKKVKYKISSYKAQTIFIVSN